MRYLTNITKERAVFVAEAARLSGQRVEIREHPMPVDDYDWPDPIDVERGYSAYDPRQVADYYSVVTFEEPSTDLGPFWRQYDKLRDEAEKPK